MGMDIYGRNPQLKSNAPEIDWTSANEEEQKAYFEHMNEFEKDNPGRYFRANLWSWRPIHMLIEHVNQFYNLGIDTSEYGTNSGAGLETQEECDDLANTLEYILQSDENMEDEGDRVYLHLGMWVNEDGNFLRDEVSEALNSEYEMGTIMYTPVVTDKGEIVKPAWSTSKEHLEDFIKFLRHCGGFEIW